MAPAELQHLFGGHTDTTLETLRGIDGSVYESLLASLRWLEDYLTEDDALATLSDLLSQIAIEAADAAFALTQRFAVEAEIIADTAGLRRWALHGLQSYRNEPKQRLAHFTRGDPRVFADQEMARDSAHLLSHRDSLLYYLRGFGCHDHGIDLHEPVGLHLPQPAARVSAGMVLMPRRFEAGDGEREIFYRATIAHIAAHLKYSPLARVAGNRHPLQLAILSLVEDARVERLMTNEFPGLHTLWGKFHVATKADSGFDYAGLAARLSRALHDPEYEDSNSWVRKGRSLFEQSAALDLHDTAAFDRVGRELFDLFKAMRLELLPHHRPSPIYRDDNLVLWDTNSSMPFDDERERDAEIEIRHDQNTSRDEEVATLDLHRRHYYPEWDNRLGALRDKWVTVLEPLVQRKHLARSNLPVIGRDRILGVQRIPDRSIRLNRLSEGDELDLNAAVECAVLRRANIAPDDRIFRRHGRRHRAISVILLMDLSQSTSRFVPGSFTTVMEVEKRAASAVAQALEDRNDRVAVRGFASNGRHEVHYERIKDFDENFGLIQQSRLQSLRGGLSTRMGAALRHASYELDREAADQKVILMLTDGEPSDIDVVEDDYLVEDAREAVINATNKGIRTFCVTLDRRADNYVRRIFGVRNYLIADRADTFVGRTGQTLMKLVAL